MTVRVLHTDRNLPYQCDAEAPSGENHIGKGVEDAPHRSGTPAQSHLGSSYKGCACCASEYYLSCYLHACTACNLQEQPQFVRQHLLLVVAARAQGGQPVLKRRTLANCDVHMTS